MSEMINAFDMAQSQFDNVAGLLNLDPENGSFWRMTLRLDEV